MVMDEKSFVIGDTVLLKSGGPRMTVINNELFGVISCLCGWFDNQHEFHTEVFPAESLLTANQ